MQNVMIKYLPVFRSSELCRRFRDDFSVTSGIISPESDSSFLSSLVNMTGRLTMATTLSIFEKVSEKYGPNGSVSLYQFKQMLHTWTFSEGQ